MTQREKDVRAEKELSKFLDRNFYEQIVRSGRWACFERIEDVALQKQGADVIVDTAAGGKGIVDEKAQLHYINRTLPTFALELDFLLDGDVIDGWFLNDRLKTTSYLFLWPDAATADLETIVSGDFTRVEAMLISKRKLKGYLDGLGLDRAYLKGAARRIREQRLEGRQEISLDGSGTLQGLWLYASLSMREQPVNLVVRKQVLAKVATRHFIITQDGCSFVADGS